MYGPAGNFRAEIDGLYSGAGFPTGGIITNASELANIYETGEGKIKVRAKTVIEKGDNGRTNIVITEIPYTVSGNKTKLVESISGLMKDKVFDEIYDVQDVSSKEGIRIVIEVKKRPRCAESVKWFVQENTDGRHIRGKSAGDPRWGTTYV